ncbi:MAG: hypothetical protein N3F04_01835 [Candidatus Nezhaarchaeota archaeon]|nr:hypothetical protein [Candidatus Nezhaarchaeota archaeon]MCX8141518.1 hypothetical protein [Candidatus Nezhaarchaeota archaeon]MDW8049785.1 hypothetical protein [Nitrososphaerota archaeon]
MKSEDSMRDRAKCDPPSGIALNNRQEKDKYIKLCPFQGFRICNNACKYYVCHGYHNVIEERIKKGYASKYLSSVLF